MINTGSPVWTCWNRKYRGLYRLDQCAAPIYIDIALPLARKHCQYQCTGLSFRRARYTLYRFFPQLSQTISHCYQRARARARRNNQFGGKTRVLRAIVLAMAPLLFPILFLSGNLEHVLLSIVHKVSIKFIHERMVKRTLTASPSPPPSPSRNKLPL